MKLIKYARFHDFRGDRSVCVEIGHLWWKKQIGFVYIHQSGRSHSWYKSEVGYPASVVRSKRLIKQLNAIRAKEEPLLNA